VGNKIAEKRMVIEGQKNRGEPIENHETRFWGMTSVIYQRHRYHVSMLDFNLTSV